LQFTGCALPDEPAAVAARSAPVVILV